MKYHLSYVVMFLSVVFSMPCYAWEKVNFQSRAMKAGKALLGKDAYQVSRTLGVANFSPELSFPVELLYDSSEKSSGLFGYGWRCPQLESRMTPRRNGAEWLSPWGEKIRFFNKERRSDSKDTLDLYRDRMKGARGCFAPYTPWDAVGKDGDWTITGIRGKEGWKFYYRDSRLARVIAPTGRSLSFDYNNGLLTSVSQDDKSLITLDADRKTGFAGSMKINGVNFAFTSARVNTVLLPNKIDTAAKDIKRTMLASVKRGTLAPAQFSYDSYGFLSGIKQGTMEEKITVQHETPEECLAWFKKIDEYRKAKKKTHRISKSHKIRRTINGRIASDSNFKYSYHKETVRLTDKFHRTASYNYVPKTGILKVTDFNGKKSTMYYFRRLDVAYNGRIRLIEDGQGRVIASYKYDKDTGNLLRVRDMADNETFFSYNSNGQLAMVSRSNDAYKSGLQRVSAFKYDSRGNRTAIMGLTPSGKVRNTANLRYNNNCDLISASAAGKSVSLSVNTFGRVTQSRDAFGNTSTMRYDAFNRLVERDAPNGTLTTYEYDASGQPQAVKTYRTKAKKELLSSLYIERDTIGRVVEIRDQRGRVRKTEYDADGKLARTIFPDGHSNSYAYDKIGQLAKVTDRNGNHIKFKHDRYGRLADRITAVGQVVSSDYDQNGNLTGITRKYRSSKKTDFQAKYTRDRFDRVTKIAYADGRYKTFAYDSRGKLLKTEQVDFVPSASVGSDSDQNLKPATVARRTGVAIKYDPYGNIAIKLHTESINGKQTERFGYKYAYDNWNRRTSILAVFPDKNKRQIKYIYDRYGRLLSMKEDLKSVDYTYDSKGRLIKRVTGGIPVYFTYTDLGQLKGKYLNGTGKDAVAFIEYNYGPDGQIVSRSLSGKLEQFEYDTMNRLLSVKDADGKYQEKYVYDPAGNMLEKTVDGKTTKFQFDKSNQLSKASMPDGSTTVYNYDGAGRLISETNSKSGRKDYKYAWLDKVVEMNKFSATASDRTDTMYNYYADGQLSDQVTVGAGSESFYWDGLALLRRDDTNLTNEPAVTGGNPIMADGKVLFNDMLGSTLGSVEKGKYTASNLNLFGNTLDNDKVDKYTYFTGKPNVEGLGYAFLFRNYRPELAKWQTSDPLGYPDGWNNFAYVNNRVANFIDWLGAGAVVVVVPKAEEGKSLDSTEQLIVNYYEQEKANGSSATLVYATNYADAKTQLENLSSEESISQLTLSGHGAAGIQNIGSTNNTNGDVSISAMQTDDFYENINFTDNASIWYEGCNTGDNLGPANLADSTANSTGKTTYAPTDYVNWGVEFGGTYYRDLPSSYHTANPVSE